MVDGFVFLQFISRIHKVFYFIILCNILHAACGMFCKFYTVLRDFSCFAEQIRLLILLRNFQKKDKMESYIDINRQLWNARVASHTESEFYDLPAFKAGKSSLMPIELAQIGDVKGKKILHLQCHFGMDSLSLARMGAKITGVDFSEKAIEMARKLNEELQLDARFVCCNVYDLPQHLDEQFDLVFTSYGVVGWLDDLNAWGRLIARFLIPGGVFHLIEFHPVIWMFDDDFKKVTYSYFNVEPIVEEASGTYADRSAPIHEQSVGFNHSIAEVMNALIRNGLQISGFEEYDYSPYNCLNCMVVISENHFQIEGMEGKLPMVYSLMAEKPVV